MPYSASTLRSLGRCGDFPIVGGVLAAVAWNAPFLAYLLGLPLALVAARYLEEPDHERETRGLAYLRGAVTALAGTQAVVLYGAAFMTELLLFGAILTMLPFFMSSSYGLMPAMIVLVLAAAELSSVVVSAMNGRLAQQVSNDGLIVMDSPAMALACSEPGSRPRRLPSRARCWSSVPASVSPCRRSMRTSRASSPSGSARAR